MEATARRARRCRPLGSTADAAARAAGHRARRRRQDRRLHPDSGAEGLAFNALNWLRSLDPNTTLSSPMFGQILTSADPCIMPLALKSQFCHFWNVDLAIAPHTHTSG